MNAKRKFFWFKVSIPASVLFMVALWQANIQHMDVYLVAVANGVLAFGFAWEWKSKIQAEEEGRKHWESMTEREREENTVI